MLSCKQVAALASDYLDNKPPGDNASLKWQMRVHLLMCANCRRFARHLKITREISANLTADYLKDGAQPDAETVWKEVQERIKKERLGGR